MRIIEAAQPHCDRFEERIGEIKFRKADPEELDPWAFACVDLYCGALPLGSKNTPPPIEWEIGDLGIRSPGAKRGQDPSVIIKIHGIEGISYLDVFPETNQFLWIEDLGHHESIHPDKAMLILLSRMPDVSGSVAIDEKGKSVLDLDIRGRKITMLDERERK